MRPPAKWQGWHRDSRSGRTSRAKSTGVVAGAGRAGARGAGVGDTGVGDTGVGDTASGVAACGVAAGGTGWGGIDLEQLVRTHGLGSQVRLLGYQGDESLALLYAGARALVWPTFYEGFGLPPLEAMATGTPVIAGATSSIPEVVADAGLLVDPHDPAAISAAMQAVLEDRTLADRLNQAGRRRAAEFSWGRCAAEHAALYRRVAE